MAEHFTLIKKKLPPGIKNHYCPYCYKSKQKELVNTKKSVFDELDTLTFIKDLQVMRFKSGEEKKYIDEFWTCPNCRKRIDDKDFLKSYCTNSSGEKYTDADFNKKPDSNFNEVLKKGKNV